ncbi:hypothetical protein [Spirosoma koreense]
MQVLRNTLEELRANDTLECSENLHYLVIKWQLAVDYFEPNRDRINKILLDSQVKRQMPKPGEIPSALNTLKNRIDKINSLAKDFIEEMRLNSYELSEGAKRNTYAVDCATFIENCEETRKILWSIIDSIKDENYSALKEISSILSSFASSFRIGPFIDSFERYYYKIEESFTDMEVDDDQTSEESGAEVLSTTQEQENQDLGLKLKWNCKPAIAGYIISELIRARYIEPPTTNGELSFAKLAGICQQIFDIKYNGKPTTLDHLKKVVNPESNTLPDYKRAKLNLPDLEQLT